MYKYIKFNRDFGLTSGGVSKKIYKDKFLLLDDKLIKDNKFLGVEVTETKEFDYKKYNGENLDKKTLIVWRPGGIGDDLFACAVIRYLKHLYPKSKISFGTNKRFHGLLQDIDYIDKLYATPLEEETLNQFDYHLNFEGTVETSKDKEYNVYDMFFDHAGIKSDTVPVEFKRPKITFNSDADRKARNVLNYDVVAKKDDVKVIVQVKSTAINRTYPYDKMMKTIYGLISCGIHVIIVGQAKDFPWDPKSEFVTNLCGKLKLEEIAALISKCNMVLSNDSAFGHLSAAFDIPNIILYSCFSHNSRSKYYPKVYPLECTWPKCKFQFKHHREKCLHLDKNGFSLCWNTISPEKILITALEILSPKLKQRYV